MMDRHSGLNSSMMVRHSRVCASIVHEVESPHLVHTLATGGIDQVRTGAEVDLRRRMHATRQPALISASWTLLSLPAFAPLPSSQPNSD
jgi:hypothetical protein